MQPLDPQAQELPIADLPDDLLHNLNPTRQCESDHLSQATQDPLILESISSVWSMSSRLWGGPALQRLTRKW